MFKKEVFRVSVSLTDSQEQANRDFVNSGMIKANYYDKDLIVDILVKSFADNKSVNYIVKQDAKKSERLKRLMGYSFDVCYLYGEIFLSEDKKGCALMLLPDKKKTSLRSIGLGARLVLSVIGLLNIKKALSRKSRINKIHPKTPFYYLWFIGVEPSKQNNGIGTKLLREVVHQGISQGRPIYLETSTEKNVPWYEKFGFATYSKLDFGYCLYCMKME